MAGSTWVSIALVGLALICGGLVVVALIVVFRTAGEHSIEFLMMMARGGKESDEEDSHHFASPRPDLRSIAQAQDFDTALARHVVQDEIEPHVAKPSPQAPFADAPPGLGSRGSNGHVRHDEDNDAFSDLLDDHGEP